MFAFVGYRTPTSQHLRLGARKDGTLTALGHELVEQSPAVKEYTEQTAVPSRWLYAAQARKTAHRVRTFSLVSLKPQ